MNGYLPAPSGRRRTVPEPPPATTFSTLSVVESNSSAVGSWLWTVMIVGLPAGTWISAGVKRWSLITRSTVVGSSAWAGAPMPARPRARPAATSAARRGFGSRPRREKDRRGMDEAPRVSTLLHSGASAAGAWRHPLISRIIRNNNANDSRFLGETWFPAQLWSDQPPKRIK